MNYFSEANLKDISSTAPLGEELPFMAHDDDRLNVSVPKNDDFIARPSLVVLGVGGAGGNAVNNMIQAKLGGVDFVVANTDAQALRQSLAATKIQLGGALTEGLGAGTDPETGRAAAEESMDEVLNALGGAHMVFITAGMGGGTGTGAAPEIAKELKASGILTVGVVTRPFDFEGLNRRKIADAGIDELERSVDTMIVIPNQHLFRIANENALFSDAMKMADEVLYNGVRAISDLVTGSGTWNLDLADVRTLMTGMGKAMMGTGEAEGEGRALKAAEIAISNPLLEDMDLSTAKGMLINISAGEDLTFYEVEAAASRIKAEIPADASIVVGQCTNPELSGKLRVSVVATGLDQHGTATATAMSSDSPQEQPIDQQQHSGAWTPDRATTSPQAAQPQQAFDNDSTLSNLSARNLYNDNRQNHWREPSTDDYPAGSPAPVPPMPTHRDTQALDELVASRQPVSSPSATNGDETTATAYERAIANAQEQTNLRRPTAFSAQMPHQSAAQSTSRSHINDSTLASADSPYNQPSTAAFDNNGRSADGVGIFDKMRNMVSRATRSHDGMEPQLADHASYRTLSDSDDDTDPPSGPNGPGGGSRANAEAAQATFGSSPFHGHRPSAATQPQPLNQPAQRLAEQSALATSNRIRAITSPLETDNAQDDLLVDIPAFLRRQYN